MDKMLKLSWILLMAALLSTLPAQACRYNVRDVGSVDLGYDSWYIFGFVDEQTADEVVSGLKEVISSKLSDTNVLSEIINVDDSPAHPAMELVTRHSIDSYPAVVFAGPEQQSRVVKIGKTAETAASTLGAAIEHLIGSPKRREIRQAAVTTYGVVLLIEGKDAEENKRAVAAAQAAVKTIGENMDYLPKPIDKPPLVLTLEQKSFEQEEMLLWFLGLKGKEIVRPHAAVFYGRARQIGPVLKPEEVTEDILTNILSIIGADCECGLDRRWMEGVMFPAKWDPKIRAELAKSLGFDPDNPMVKMEISMILRKGPASRGGFGDMSLLGGSPFGYQEIEVVFEEPDKDPADSEPNDVAETVKPDEVIASVVETTSPEPHVEEPIAVAATETSLTGPQEAVATAEGGLDTSFIIAIAILGVIGVAVVAVGVLIFRKAQS